MGPTFAGEVAAPAMEVAASSTIESGGRVLGPFSVGAVVALAVGGAGASTVEACGASTVPAIRGVMGGMRGMCVGGAGE